MLIETINPGCVAETLVNEHEDESVSLGSIRVCVCVCVCGGVSVLCF